MKGLVPNDHIAEFGYFVFNVRHSVYQLILSAMFSENLLGQARTFHLFSTERYESTVLQKLEHSTKIIS